MKIAIAVLDDYQQVALKMADWSAVAARCDITVFDRHLGDEDAVARALEGFEIVCVMRERTPFTRELLQRLPSLSLLVTTGARNDSIDIAAASELGVLVCGTGAPGHAASELTWALLLALAKRIVVEERALREQRWQTGLGLDLKGRTLGILGLGRHGSNLARYGAAFGMPVIAWSQNLTSERAAECGATLVGREQLFRDADVLTVHLKLSERTRGLVGAAELALMKPTALLLNTSRGPIVDEAALIDALREGRIAGAGLDVYDVEPLPADHPLRDCPNTVLMPHVGYVTEETYRMFFADTVKAVLGYLDGKPVRVIAP